MPPFRRTDPDGAYCPRCSRKAVEPADAAALGDRFTVACDNCGTVLRVEVVVIVEYVTTVAHVPGSRRPSKR